MHVGGQYSVFIGPALATYFNSPCCPSTTDGASGCSSPFGYLVYKGGCSNTKNLWIQINHNFANVTVDLSMTGNVGPY